MRLCSVFIALLFAGCASSTPPLPEEIASAISPGSNTIVLNSELTLDELFGEARRHLIGNGFDLTRYSLEMRLIATDQVEIGRSTAFRIILQAGEVGTGTQLEAAGFWADISMQQMMSAGPGTTGEHLHWEQASWQGSEQATLAFGQLARLINDIPHTEVLYITK